MKGFNSVLVLVVSLFAMSSGFAATKMMDTMDKSMWYCTTNATSAASGTPAYNADKEMNDNAKMGAASFAFALKNCRDCTKITCTKK